MSLLERTYKRIRKYYSRNIDSPLSIAITSSFACVAILTVILLILDLALLENRIQILYEKSFGAFTFRILIVPIIVLTIFFTHQFKKYDSKNTGDKND